MQKKFLRIFAISVVLIAVLEAIKPNNASGMTTAEVERNANRRPAGMLCSRETKTIEGKYHPGTPSHIPARTIRYRYVNNPMMPDKVVEMPSSTHFGPGWREPNRYELQCKYCYRKMTEFTRDVLPKISFRTEGGRRVMEVEQVEGAFVSKATLCPNRASSAIEWTRPGSAGPVAWEDYVYKMWTDAAEREVADLPSGQIDEDGYGETAPLTPPRTLRLVYGPSKSCCACVIL